MGASNSTIRATYKNIGSRVIFQNKVSTLEHSFKIGEPLELFDIRGRKITGTAVRCQTGIMYIGVSKNGTVRKTFSGQN